MRSLFIYYRVAVTRAAAAFQAAQALQLELRDRHPGLVAVLWRRPGEQDGMQTWMETYTHPEGVSPELEALIIAAAQNFQRDWIQGPRHVEVFEQCTP